MAPNASWVILCQSHSFSTLVILFKVSLFNGISSFVGYFVPKSSLWNSRGTIKPIAGGYLSEISYSLTTTFESNTLTTLPQRCHRLKMKKKLDGKYTRMLRAILNKSWRQHPHKTPTGRPLASHHENYTNRRTRRAGHCWRSKDKLISDVLLWTPVYGQAKAGRPARTYIQQLCEDTGCSPEDPPKAMNDREKWRERVRDMRASGTT